MKQIVIEKRGFTLIEVIVAIAVIVTALVGLIGLISFSISGLTPAKSRVIAVNLAQEGIEIVRNIRDSNWMRYRSEIEQGESWRWTTGLAAGTYRAQYNSPELLSLSENPTLSKDTNGFYQYGSGTQTPFRRRIIIENLSADEIRVTSEVTWSEKGKNNTVSVQTHFFNWFK
ncbi:MAG: type IV pilus modification PilV family protein [Patescibacteria group bacterium]